MFLYVYITVLTCFFSVIHFYFFSQFYVSMGCKLLKLTLDLLNKLYEPYLKPGIWPLE